MSADASRRAFLLRTLLTSLALWSSASSQHFNTTALDVSRQLRPQNRAARRSRPPPRTVPSVEARPKITSKLWYMRLGLYTNSSITLNELQTAKAMAEQSGNAQQRFMPQFVKFHKVGSGTMADLFRLTCDLSASRIGGVTPWRCGAPHDHWTMGAYQNGGQEAFNKCTYNLAPVKLFTVIRDPIEKFMSAAYFWTRLTPKHLAEALQTPSKATVEQIAELCKVMFNDGVPKDVTDAGSLLEYTTVFSRLPQRMLTKGRPTEADLDAGCANMQRDFVVGVTEKMNSFMVLVALELDWPLARLCHANLHVNRARPKSDEFPREVIELLEQKLAPDRKLYQCAKQLHDEQIARHSNFASMLSTFESPEQRQRCQKVVRQRKQHESRLGSGGARVERSLKCQYWSPEVPKAG